MSDDQEENLLDEATRLLHGVQNFDVEELPREAELGRTFSFAEAVEPASNMVALYRKLSPAILPTLPDQQLTQIRNHAKDILAKLESILEFDPREHEPASAERDRLIKALVESHQNHFNILSPIIAYGFAQSTDLKELEREARRSIEGIEAKTSATSRELEQARDEAERIISEVRDAAAAEGVSKQAKFFKIEADKHNKSKAIWQRSVIVLSVIIIVYAVASLFLHIAVPSHDAYGNIQLVVSKLLIFAILAALFLLAVKNFLSHTHNEIVNRHRQNALLTYQSLVDATDVDSGAREIVLSYAASCIFSPQETGYTKAEKPGSLSQEFIPKPLWRVDTTSNG